MNTLLEKSIKYYIIIGLFLYVILYILYGDVYSYYNILNFMAFISYAFLLYTATNRQEGYYKARRLAITVFFYTLIFVGMYQYMGEYYAGNTFLFSEADAKTYQKIVNSMVGMPVWKWIPYLQNDVRWGYDDYGAPIFMSIIYGIFPHKLFLNFIYILLNVASAVMLFRISEAFMMKSYAYLATLTYSTASYVIFFMGSGLKEVVFMFAIISSMYMLYRYERSRNIGYLVWGGGNFHCYTIFPSTCCIVYLGIIRCTSFLWQSKYDKASISDCCWSNYHCGCIGKRYI